MTFRSELIRRQPEDDQAAGQNGEYDSYVGGLCAIIRGGGTEQELFEYLWTVETASIGLEGDRSATRAFAARLSSLRSAQKEDR